MFLIDGYNLLHALAKGRATKEGRERLIDLVETYCARGYYSACLVFDATRDLRPRERRGDVEIRCVPQGQTADAEIITLLSSTSDRTAYTVVTDDREIVREARKRRAKVVSCADFVRTLHAPPAADAPGDPRTLSGPEVDYWMREFGFDEGPDSEKK